VVDVGDTRDVPREELAELTGVESHGRAKVGAEQFDYGEAARTCAFPALLTIFSPLQLVSSWNSQEAVSCRQCSTIPISYQGTALLGLFHDISFLEPQIPTELCNFFNTTAEPHPPPAIHLLVCRHGKG
jgi:hypothetical protein